MDYNKSNAAYDLSNFAPAPEQLPEKTETEKKKPAAVHRKKKAKKNSVKPSTVVKWVFVSLFVMISLGSIMVGNIRVTQINDKTTRVEKQLDIEKSKAVKLNSSIETRMSISTVENYAVNKLGLSKTQSYQIQYINLTDKDKVQILEKPSGLENIMQNVINTVEEYFT